MQVLLSQVPSAVNLKQNFIINKAYNLKKSDDTLENSLFSKVEKLVYQSIRLR